MPSIEICPGQPYSGIILPGDYRTDRDHLFVSPDGEGYLLARPAMWLHGLQCNRSIPRARQLLRALRSRMLTDGIKHALFTVDRDNLPMLRFARSMNAYMDEGTILFSAKLE